MAAFFDASDRCLFLKDEKLQDVLGHFQKDFEGGVSAENLGKSNKQTADINIFKEPRLCRLISCYRVIYWDFFLTGAKFGGYGSFLPSHQRSPVLSHPRTPLKVHNTPRSPNKLHTEVDIY